MAPMGSDQVAPPDSGQAHNQTFFCHSYCIQGFLAPSYIYRYMNEFVKNRNIAELSKTLRAAQTNSKMLISPVLPDDLFAIYCASSVVALVLCLMSLIAIYRTRRTPYPTKLLCMGVLFYDSLFLISANVGKFFCFEDGIVFRYLKRGFHMAAQIVVSFMAFERLLVFNWPYLYLKLATKKLTRKVCIGIIGGSFLQYLVIRGIGCYASSSCGLVQAVYYTSICLLFLMASFAAYIKIYRILREKEANPLTLRQYKGTIASFLYLLNSTCSAAAYFGISLYLSMRVASNTELDGTLSYITDGIYMLHCILDPLINAMWFTETRLEILKMIAVVCVCLKPRTEKMRIRVFGITCAYTNKINNVNEIPETSGSFVRDTTQTF